MHQKATRITHICIFNGINGSEIGIVRSLARSFVRANEQTNQPNKLAMSAGAREGAIESNSFSNTPTTAKQLILHEWK